MVIAPLLVSTLIVAQPPPDRTVRFRSYGFASGMISVQPGTGEAYHRIPDRLNGNTWVASGGAGVFLTPSIGLEGEFVFAGTVSAPQEFHYTASEEYIASNRDILINELVRYRAGGRAAVQLVGGGGYAHTTTGHTSAVYVDSFGKRTAVPDSPPVSYSSLTLTGGLDASFRVSDHAAVGPTFRLRWQHRAGADDVAWTGIGPFSFQFGASVMFR